MAIDWGSIMSKANAYLASSPGKTKIQNEVDSITLGIKQAKPGQRTPEQAGFLLASIIDSTIAETGLSPGVKAAISGFTHGDPFKIGDNQYCVIVSNGMMSRPSLIPEKYGYIEDLTRLYNDGVDHVMRPVRGYWHGEETWSRTTIPYSGFLERAKDDFMGNYGSEFNVIKCELM